MKQQRLVQGGQGALHFAVAYKVYLIEQLI